VSIVTVTSFLIATYSASAVNEALIFNGQGRWHLMAPVDKGYLKLDSNLKELEYFFSVVRTFYITSMMALFFGLISQGYWIELIFFL
jgi:hypothetical protein